MPEFPMTPALTGEHVTGILQIFDQLANLARHATLWMDAFEPNGGRAGIDGHDELLAAFEEEQELLGVGTPVVADRHGINARPLQVVQQVGGLRVELGVGLHFLKRISRVLTIWSTMSVAMAQRSRFSMRSNSFSVMAKFEGKKKALSGQGERFLCLS
jgi:hypothetical protein